MKLWILYKSPSYNHDKSPQMMLEAAIAKGIDAELYYHNLFCIILEKNAQILCYKGERVNRLPDLVFSRGYDFELLEFLENHGVRVINTSFGMNLIRNKYATHKFLSEIKGLSQPKTLKTPNYQFSMIEKELSLPFIMKDNLGWKGEHVYLVDNEKHFDEIIKLNPDIDFICQEYINTSKGKDLRCYIIGNKVFAIKRFSNSENDFRTNIHQGGRFEVYDISEELANLSLKIAEHLNLEIGSVDFLFGKNDEPVFCEANGNAAFRAYAAMGIDLRNEFFAYILNNFTNLKNVLQQKIDLQLLGNSFEIIQGSLPIIVSAPHSVQQIRNLDKKSLELGTADLMLNLVNNSGVSGIIKTNCTGVVGERNDDANYDDNHPYKPALSKFIKENNIKALIDIHALSKTRPEQVNIGVDGGENIQNRHNILKGIEDIFYKNGFLVSIDYPFRAGKRTITKYISQSNNIFSIQVELNSKLINFKSKQNQFDEILNSLKETVHYLNETIKA